MNARFPRPEPQRGFKRRNCLPKISLPPEDDAEIVRSVRIVRVRLQSFAKPIRGRGQLILLDKMDALCNELPRQLRVGRLRRPETAHKQSAYRQMRGAGHRLSQDGTDLSDVSAERKTTAPRGIVVMIMYRVLAIAIFGACISMGATDGFVSLMPRHDVTELWTIEGTPSSAWRVEKGEIFCAGKPNGFLRSKKTYRNYILRAEWRFKKEGWVAKPEDEGWPNAGFFINAGATVDGWPTSQEVQGHFGEAGSLFGVRGGAISGARRGPFVKDRIPFGE